MAFPFMAVAGALGAGLGFLGQERANIANVRMAREQMAFQERSAREQMAFQERMSNTQVQRQMADLRAAGVNPMLAVMRGAPGAGTPPGASAQGARAEVRDAFGPAADRAMAGVASAIAAKRSKAELELLRAQTEDVEARARLTEQQRLDLIGDPGRPMIVRNPDGSVRIGAPHAGAGRGALTALEEARARIQQVTSASELNRVNARLAQLEIPGASNRARLEEILGREFGVSGSAARAMAELFLRALQLGSGRRR